MFYWKAVDYKCIQMSSSNTECLFGTCITVCFPKPRYLSHSISGHSSLSQSDQSVLLFTVTYWVWHQFNAEAHNARINVNFAYLAKSDPNLYVGGCNTSASEQSSLDDMMVLQYYIMLIFSDHQCLIDPMICKLYYMYIARLEIKAAILLNEHDICITQSAPLHFVYQLIMTCGS